MDKIDLLDVQFLQNQFSDYLADSVFTSRAEKSLVRHVLARGDACIFGGVIRDFLLKRDADEHRDIDLVLQQIDRPLEKYIQSFLVRKNRFGGYKLFLGNKYYDIWALNDTWAVKRYGKIRHSLSILPSTSFFNVNAIIFSLGQGQFVMHKKFRESIENRVLDIVYEPNPCPELCIVKAYQLVRELHMCTSKRVIQYLSTWFDKVRNNLIDIQLSHFGNVRYSLDDLERFTSKAQVELSFINCSDEDTGLSGTGIAIAGEQSISCSNQDVVSPGLKVACQS